MEKSLCFLFYSAKLGLLLEDRGVNVKINAAAVKHRLLGGGGATTSRPCILYLLQQGSQLFGSSISGADGLLRSDHRADAATFSVLS